MACVKKGSHKTKNLQQKQNETKQAKKMVNLLDFLGPHGNTLPSKFDDNHGSILVTDAQGVVGYRVANKLLATGYPSVKVGLRDTSLAAEFKKNGAHIVQFDFDKPETFLHALEGVHKVYFSAPHHENWEEKFDAFLKAAKTRKVEHIVKLSICHSFYKNDPFTKVPLVKMHREMDKSLAKHGSPNYTILLASHFMSNPTVYQEDILRKEHRFVGASGAKGVAYVSPNDVADLAARALLAPGDYKRKMIHVTGPELITDTQVAEILT